MPGANSKNAGSTAVKTAGVTKSYCPDENRYKNMIYNRVGKSGLKLPALSLGLWHNFGTGADLVNCAGILTAAFDNGITHFDLANNYGPDAGSAEATLGKILKTHFSGYRDELIISTKAGYYMWDGPYGEYSGKKYLVSSLDQSLKRLNLDYVDIYYSHRPDPDTPFEETAGALDLIVRQGKALYIGISNYSAGQTAEITRIFRELKTPFIIHQPAYNMLNRWIEDGLTEVLTDNGLGCIVFSPLAQGVLTDRYLKGVPKDSRASIGHFLKETTVQRDIDKVRKLKAVADNRNQTIAQLAIAWVLNNKAVTSVLFGASRAEQVTENIKALDNLSFTAEELKQIDDIIK